MLTETILKLYYLLLFYVCLFLALGMVTCSDFPYLCKLYKQHYHRNLHVNMSIMCSGSTIAAQPSCDIAIPQQEDANFVLKGDSSM